MTTAYKGRDFVLQMGNGATSETFATVGALRTTSLSINNNPVDITNVSSNGWQEMLGDAGTQSVEISADGVVANDAQFATFETAAHDRTTHNYQLVSGVDRDVTRSGSFVISSYSETGAHGDAPTFNVTLQSNGAITRSVTPST